MRKIARVQTAMLRGVDAIPVTVEVDIEDGLPGTVMIGLPDTHVIEARERVRAAMLSARFAYPRGHVVVNLLPHDARKSGTGFDLPIAIAILRATEQIPTPEHEEYMYVGELGLDGSVRAVRGMPSFAYLAERSGCQYVGGSVPKDARGNLLCIDTGSVLQVPSCAIGQLYIENLGELRNGSVLSECGIVKREEPERPDIESVLDEKWADSLLDAIQNHEFNVFETQNAKPDELELIADYINYCSDAMTDEQIRETAANQSAAYMDIRETLKGRRPVVWLNPSMSLAGIIGGGNPIIPGEVSSAHNGVVIIEDMYAYSGAVYTALASAMNMKVIELCRAEGRYAIPAEFKLLVNRNTMDSELADQRMYQLYANHIRDAKGIRRLGVSVNREWPLECNLPHHSRRF